VSEPAPFGPYYFSLTDEEVRVAASRIAFRGDLSRRFERDHVAPLVAFVLLLVFVAILAFSGLLNRRIAEAALLLGAIAFMASRFVSHWRLRGAHKSSLAAVQAVARWRDLQVLVDLDGACLKGVEAARRCSFGAGARIENVAGLIYLWPKEGEPILIPVRAFADPGEVERFVNFARRRMADRSGFNASC
jgi:hypothetical protein